MWQKCRTLRRRRDGGEQPIGEVVLRLRRYRKRDLRQADPVAAHALFPGVEHAPVVLVGGDHLVAGAEIDAELRDLQGLAGVAGDGELLGVAAEFRRELAPDALDVRLEHLPHVVDGRLVREIEIALEGLVDDARARAAAAVVEIDDGAIEGERRLDFPPVVLVGGDRVGGLALHGFARRAHARFAVVAERRGERGRTGDLEQLAAGQHGRAPLSDRFPVRFSVFRSRCGMTEYPDPGAQGLR